MHAQCVHVPVPSCCVKGIRECLHAQWWPSILHAYEQGNKAGLTHGKECGPATVHIHQCSQAPCTTSWRMALNRNKSLSHGSCAHSDRSTAQACTIASQCLVCECCEMTTLGLVSAAVVQVVGDSALAQQLVSQPCVVKVFSRGQQACQEADCLGSAYLSLAELAHRRCDRLAPRPDMLSSRLSCTAGRDAETMSLMDMWLSRVTWGTCVLLVTPYSHS